VLTKVQAFSSWASVPMLSLDADGREETDLIQIRNIDGLDPVKATVSTSPFGSVDGVSFTGTRVDSRNIVLTLHPNPDWDNWTNDKLRKLLYRYFMPKLMTRLVFYSDDISPVEIFGYVEDIQANSFAKDLEYQVSIICPDPYFTAVTPSIMVGVSGQWSTVEYNGDVETGVFLRVTQANEPPSNYLYVAFGPDHKIFTVWYESVTEYKYFTMSSIYGQRFVRSILISGGTFTNLLSKVEDSAPWPVLIPGDNDFCVVTDHAGNEDWELTYYERYGGL
jgi:hypothetical protein